MTRGLLKPNLSRVVRVLIAIATTFVVASGASAAGPSVPACQSTIEKASAAFLNATIRAEQACFKRVAQGKLPRQTRCRGENSDVSLISDSKTLAKILDARDKVSAAIHTHCAGVDLFAAPPDGIGFPSICPIANPACTLALDGLDAVANCLMCADLSAAQSVVGVEHPIGIGSVALVDFTFDTMTQLQAFQVHVTYSLPKGAFRGSGENVACSHSAEPGTIFIQNHKDSDGIIIFIAAADQQTITELALPIDIQCLFDVAAGQSLAPTDFVVDVDEVTQNGAIGDPSTLLVTVDVSP